MGPNNYMNGGQPQNGQQQFLSGQSQNGQQFSNGQYPSYMNNANMGTIINPYENYMVQSPMRVNQTNQFLKCRPVVSKEEAMAYQVDLDGSLWVFTNTPNGKIYTKQINNDGTATFKTYTETQDENPYGFNNYVTKEEFNQVVQSIMAAIAPASNAGTATANKNNVEQQKPIDF